MATLVDTNILVYCFDPEAPSKQAACRHLLRQGSYDRSLYIPHQALVEFVSVVTRVRPRKGPLLPPSDAVLQAEGFMSSHPILYPNEDVFVTALRGMATYQLSWFDAHLWAYAEHYRLAEIMSEDFGHLRSYGCVRVRNPFVPLGLA